MARVRRNVVNSRIRLLLALLVFVFVGLVLRAAWLQGVRAGSLARLAHVQHRQSVTLPAGRGTIFDRTGLPLALGRDATTVYADPAQIRDPHRAARAAADALRLDADELYPRLAPPQLSLVCPVRRAAAPLAAAP